MEFYRSLGATDWHAMPVHPNLPLSPTQQAERYTPHPFPIIDQIRIFHAHGPWPTKSGGSLVVPFSLPIDATFNFFNYDPIEIARINYDIRGLRTYIVSGLPANQIGGTEFHRVRQEIVINTRGRSHWILEDLSGDSKEFDLSENDGVYIPPFMLHSYHALVNNTDLMVIANTLFDANNPQTSDTYSCEIFRQLQTKTS